MESASFASKKRKISHDDDEDDEEEKMEKFYALIKSIREARDRLIMNNSSAEIVNKEVAEQSKTKKPKLEEEKQVLVWKPSFQREDFIEEADQLKKPPMSFASTSQTKEGTDNYDQKEEVKEVLDLTLSL
ncbi:hypothetical protein CRYUN_Cryun23aG0112900 [Craigia yunnanensis]